MRARTMLSIVAVEYHLSAHIQWRFGTRRHVLPSSSIVSDGIRVMGIAIVVSRTALVDVERLFQEQVRVTAIGFAA